MPIWSSPARPSCCSCSNMLYSLHFTAVHTLDVLLCANYWKKNPTKHVFSECWLGLSVFAQTTTTTRCEKTALFYFYTSRLNFPFFALRADSSSDRSPISPATEAEALGVWLSVPSVVRQTRCKLSQRKHKGVSRNWNVASSDEMQHFFFLKESNLCNEIFKRADKYL